MPLNTTDLLIKQLKAAYPYRPRSGAKGIYAYASEAGGCARQIGLRLLGAPGQPFEDSSTVNTSIGNYIHDKMMEGISEALLLHWRSQGIRLGSFGHPRQNDYFQFEVPWAIDGLSGRADGIYYHPDLVDVPAADTPKTILEIKSMNSGSFSGALSYGPQRSHVLQASLSALELQATSIHMAYVNKLPRKGEPPGADWLLPADLDAAQEEKTRLLRTVELARDGLIPECEYEGRIISPETNKKWPCEYCAFKAICVQLGPGAMPTVGKEELERMASVE